MDRLINREILWLKQLLKNPHIGILVTDMRRKVLYVNEHLCENIGYTKEELIGQDSRIFHVSDRAYKEFFQIAINNIKEGKPISLDYQVRRKDGEILWTTISGNLVENEDEILWSVVDITDRVAKEKEIKSLKERMEIALSGFNAGVWEWNVSTGSVFVSLQWKQMLGFDEDTEVGFDFWKSRVHPDDLESALEGVRVAINNRDTNLENIHRLRHKDGKWIWVLARATIIYDKNENIRMVGIHTDITNQKRVEDELFLQKRKLEYLAHHDVLTNLPNRLLFNDRLRHSIEKAKRNSERLAVLFIDLDHFKEINDSFGHDTGDRVLQVATARFLDRIRKEDTLARLGGDEFAIIMESLTQPQDAAILAKTLVDIFKEPIKVAEYSFYLSCSIGISLFPDDDDNAMSLLKYADTAMYKAKENGRNGYAFYQEEMTHAAFQKVVIEAELRKALQNEDLLVYYQPQVDAKTGKLIGMEALVRWQNKENSQLVSPGTFLPIAESTGLIVEIDRYIIQKSLQQIVLWYKEGLEPGKVALNISVQQLIKEDFIPFITTLLSECNCKAQWLELEVTESEIMKNPADAIKILQGISRLGIALAVDDFGTGYSSLSYLKKLPIDKLKIDKSFVSELPHDEEDAAITKAVIALAKSLNLKVIAEGVETKGQKEFLLHNGCDEIQGYLYGKPMSAAMMREMLLKIK